jgi:hypothetical protein
MAQRSVAVLLLGIAIIPVAGLMGRATEHLSERVGSGVGGLLNATFGNAAELIIALMALHKGLTDVVQGIHHRFQSSEISCSCSVYPPWSVVLNTRNNGLTALRPKPPRHRCSSQR